MSDPTSRFDTESVRLRILKGIKGRFDMLTEDNALDETDLPYGIKAHKIYLGPLSDEDNRRRFVIGIVPGRETKADLFPLKEASFNVVIEFRITTSAGDQPFEEAEKALSLCQYIMMRPQPLLPNLTIMADEVRNEIDMYTHGDNSISGMTEFQIRYRHGHNTPYDTQSV